jgi:CelD/BcsL family acetyltransferase involved in cellulose biosynthesis
MECEIVNAATLSREHQERWSSIVRKLPSFDAPPFYPEFICCLATHIPFCKVAVLSDGAGVFGYLAFSEVPGTKIARSIPMCDYEPIIVEPGRSVGVRELIHAMGYRSWQFQSVLTDQLSFAAATRISTSRSPRAVLTDGFEAYRSKLNAAGKSAGNIQTKIRLLERDRGPIKLVHGLTDEAVVARLLQLKAHKYASGESFPPFVHDILIHFLRQATGRLTGNVSMLMAGDQEVASLYWLKADRLLYYWFPTYDPAMRRYSPGLLLVWSLLIDLRSLDCDSIDFGPGGEPYKEYFANAHLTVYSGDVNANAMIAAAYRAYDRLERTVRSSAVVQNYIKPVLRKTRKSRLSG